MYVCMYVCIAIRLWVRVRSGVLYVFYARHFSCSLAIRTRVHTSILRPSAPNPSPERPKSILFFGMKQTKHIKDVAVVCMYIA